MSKKGGYYRIVQHWKNEGGRLYVERELFSIDLARRR